MNETINEVWQWIWVTTHDGTVQTAVGGVVVCVFALCVILQNT
jgi:hypothetical protein